MRFEKWQALGNDYLIVERGALPFELTRARVRRLCEAHFGVGADGVLLLEHTSDPAHVAELRIFNPDGSEAELSGNGAREAILYLRRHGWTDADTFSILTAAGPIRPSITGPVSARVDMGRARLSSADYPAGADDGVAELHIDALEQAGAPARPARSWRFQHVSIGNPQCAIRLPDAAALDALDLGTEGPAIESHPDFPNRTNVSFYAELAPGPPARIRVRIFERGVGETLASGTGATGAVVAYVLERRRESAGAPEPRTRVTAVLDGGELEVEVDEDLHVELSGWALPVFSGVLSEEFVRELQELE